MCLNLKKKLKETFEILKKVFEPEKIQVSCWACFLSHGPDAHRDEMDFKKRLLDDDVKTWLEYSCQRYKIVKERCLRLERSLECVNEENKRLLYQIESMKGKHGLKMFFLSHFS